jgi:hypothetical protein
LKYTNEEIDSIEERNMIIKNYFFIELILLCCITLYAEDGMQNLKLNENIYVKIYYMPEKIKTPLLLTESLLEKSAHYKLMLDITINKNLIDLINKFNERIEVKVEKSKKFLEFNFLCIIQKNEKVLTSFSLTNYGIMKNEDRYYVNVKPFYEFVIYLLPYIEFNNLHDYFNMDFDNKLLQELKANKYDLDRIFLTEESIEDIIHKSGDILGD